VVDRKKWAVRCSKKRKPKEILRAKGARTKELSKKSSFVWQATESQPMTKISNKNAIYARKVQLIVGWLRGEISAGKKTEEVRVIPGIVKIFHHESGVVPRQHFRASALRVKRNQHSGR
jgi:hypothetical protein